jgi:3-deoxy-D-manno-octulosonic-acid transferase
MLGLYRALTIAMGPAIRLYLNRRRARGKEDPARSGEREGIASCPRPDGPLIWLHAASVGESISALCLIERLIHDHPDASVLVTTGTVTSAQIMASRLPERAIHHYIPVDRPAWVARFLDHWRPDMALWMESEFWPNLLQGVSARNIPLILINARISPSSFKGWQRVPRTIARLLNCFSLCLAQSEADAERLRILGAKSVSVPGNLKFSASPLPVNQSTLAAMMEAIGQRPVWLAASTHDGEDQAVIAAHRALASQHPKLLTIIVPRHPVRGPAIEELAAAQGHRVARRSTDPAIRPDTEIYIADTVGELGLFYRLTPVAFIGGTLISHGGQNLLEAAKLGCAIIHGPSMINFTAIADEMAQAGATEIIGDADGLSPAVGRLLRDAALHAERITAATRVADAKDGILDAVMGGLSPFLTRLGPTQPTGHSNSPRHATA